MKGYSVTCFCAFVPPSPFYPLLFRLPPPLPCLIPLLYPPLSSLYPPLTHLLSSICPPSTPFCLPPFPPPPPLGRTTISVTFYAGFGARRNWILSLWLWRITATGTATFCPFSFPFFLAFFWGYVHSSLILYVCMCVCDVVTHWSREYRCQQNAQWCHH